MVFEWISQKENRWWINNLDWVKHRGHVGHSTGSSNWPTLTGVDEYTLISYWYAGGRDVKMGDMVLVINPTKRAGQDGYWINKRVVGLEGYTTTRSIGNLGTSHLTVGRNVQLLLQCLREEFS